LSSVATVVRRRAGLLPLAQAAARVCHDPPVATPPLTLLVLDGLADDIESVGSLRDHGEVAPYGLALIDETDVVGAVRTLLDRGLIKAWEEAGNPVRLVPVDRPALDDTSLRSYWYGWTTAGERVWRENETVLDAYNTDHPSS
jgi:hypothetical protein